MGPLAGVRIIELAGIGPGPFACMLLADMGAEVLRIERIGAPVNPEARRRDPLLRSRPAIQVDLKSDAGVQFVLGLIERADVLIEGFRPGVTERMGLGPDVCLARQPRLVYGRMTGWGQEGPLAQSAGHDIDYIALTGALHAIGEAERKPVAPLNLVGDFGGGSLYLALGVVSAVLAARTSGRGQVVDAAIVDGATSLMAMMYGRLAAGSWKDTRGANLLDGGTPWYDSYLTQDGRYLAIGAIEPQFFAELIRLLEMDAAWNADRHDTARWPELRLALSARIATKTLAQWQRVLEGTDACAAPVLSMQEAASHPHMAEREVFVSVDGIAQPAPAPRFLGTPSAVRDTPARADSAWLAAHWACEPEEVERLRAAGALGN